MDVILIVVYPSLFYVWMKPMSILHMPFVSNRTIVNWNVHRLDPFGSCQSILDGWVMAEWLACRTQLTVVNRCVKRLRGPKFVAGLSLMKQFAHSWFILLSVHGDMFLRLLMATMYIYIERERLPTSTALWVRCNKFARARWGFPQSFYHCFYTVSLNSPSDR